MGNVCTDPQLSGFLRLNVITLNYGGILNSPFQFFSNQNQKEKEISNLFVKILPLYFPEKEAQIKNNTFKWDIGKIDHKFQKGRYTPLYDCKAGVTQGILGKKLIQAKSFLQKWDDSFQKCTSKIQPEPTKDQIQAMRTFDLICFHTLLAYIYKDIKSITFQRQYTLNQINIVGLVLKAEPYIQFMEQFFSRSYLDEDRKIKKVLIQLEKSSADVIFLQQPTVKFNKELQKNPKYIVKENGEQKSSVIIKKSSFNHQEQKIQKQRLQINKMVIKDIDVVLLSIDNYIFGSVHLSSKKQKNLKEVEILKGVLNDLQKNYKDFYIIIGGDVNSYVTSQNLNHFEIYPAQNIPTNRKKRTYLQPQFNKANQLNQQCKDQIFFSDNVKLKRGTICTIDDKQANENNLLPTDEHPFDHFMVLCELKGKSK